MSPSAPTTIQVQIDQGVCTLTLNRPEVRNAMSLAMINELLGTRGRPKKTRMCACWCCAARAATSVPAATSATWPRPA
ncbi:MAG: hypothetical protein QM742_17515 [Aquabacterium sp.]